MFVDTLHLFPETYAFLAEVEERYGFKAKVFTPKKFKTYDEYKAVHGVDLYLRDVKQCAPPRRLEPEACRRDIEQRGCVMRGRRRPISQRACCIISVGLELRRAIFLSSLGLQPRSTSLPCLAHALGAVTASQTSRHFACRRITSNLLALNAAAAFRPPLPYLVCRCPDRRDFRFRTPAMAPSHRCLSQPPRFPAALMVLSHMRRA